MRRTSCLLSGFFLFACAADTHPSGYDPDWDAEAPIAGGKADGVLDILPVLEMGTVAEGEVGGDRSEMYRLDLLRTDRVEITMRVTSGDLDPHLSFFYGTSSYVGSESWDRDGATLEKVYIAESAGSYVVAARAYQGRGSGSYAIGVRCLGGPCAGELPPPESDDLEPDDIAYCVSQARRCAFAELPRYEGRVGEVRARQIFDECLVRTPLGDGSTCGTACDWEGEETDSEYDDARGLCDDVIGELPFWADQSAACLGVLDSCMSDCYSAGGDDRSAEELWTTSEALCWRDGLNGTCPGFARGHEACGGNIRADSARECTELCHSTTGAYIDDLDTLCSSDSDCDSYCDVDIDQAGESCGGVTEANRTCLESWVSDNDAWMCEDALAARLGG